MINVNKIRSVTLETHPETTTKGFLDLHIHVEAYIKRVMLIGLRLNRVQYDSAVKMVEGTFIPVANLIEKAFKLLDSGLNRPSSFQAILNSHSTFSTYNTIFKSFTTVYRNRLVHGTVDEIRDNALLDLLLSVDRNFVIAFEQVLQAEYEASAFVTPTTWGAVRGNREEIDATVKRLNLGKMVPKPLTKSEVEALISVISE